MAALAGRQASASTAVQIDAGAVRQARGIINSPDNGRDRVLERNHETAQPQFPIISSFTRRNAFHRQHASPEP